MEDKKNVLDKEIKLLRKELEKSNSPKRQFIQGVLSGLGGVIGATVVVSILVFILSQLENVSFVEPFIKDIVRMVKNAS